MAESSGQVPRDQELKHLPSLVSVARSIARQCVQHPALLLSLAYVYVSAIGMLYTSALFSAFGINMLDFAETSDFLLAALRRPVALLLSAVLAAVWLGYVLSIYALMSLSGRMPARMPRSVLDVLGYFQMVTARRPRFYLRFATVLALMAWLYTALAVLSLYADSEAERLAGGAGPFLVVELRSSDAEGLPTVVEEDLSLIGSAGSFAFFYDHIEQRTQIIPTANLVRIHAMPPKPLTTPGPTTEALGAGTGP